MKVSILKDYTMFPYAKENKNTRNNHETHPSEV